MARATSRWPYPPLCQSTGHARLLTRMVSADFVKAYEDTFIKVKEWGVFESSDI